MLTVVFDTHSFEARRPWNFVALFRATRFFLVFSCRHVRVATAPPAPQHISAVRVTRSSYPLALISVADMLVDILEWPRRFGEQQP